MTDDATPASASATAPGRPAEQAAGESAKQEQSEPSSRTMKREQANRLRVVMAALIIGWTYLYNLLLKGLGPVDSFFRILDTISDDYVMGSLVAVSVGLGIIVVFSITQLYGDIIANVYSFRLIEDIYYSDLIRGRWRAGFGRILRLSSEPQPDASCPRRVTSLLFSFSFLYVMSWAYVVLFSEALFFVSWSAGVNLPLHDSQTLLLMPTLALSIPFSARVMAYLRYPHAGAYAVFMPGAAFVLLIVTSLGQLFESHDQRFFLKQVWENREYLESFLRNGAFLAFLPVFFEAGFWLIELGRLEKAVASEQDD